jgi:hypothetical protein
MNDLGRLRVSNAERDAVIARLQHATAEGRLSLDELEDRVGVTFTARTRSDLEQIVDDLPPEPEPVDEPELEAEPERPLGTSATTARALGVLAIGASSIPVTFYSRSPAGIVLSAVALLLVVSTLVKHRETATANRVILAAAGALALVPVFFALAMLALLGF